MAKVYSVPSGKEIIFEPGVKVMNGVSLKWNSSCNKSNFIIEPGSAFIIEYVEYNERLDITYLKLQGISGLFNKEIFMIVEDK